MVRQVQVVAILMIVNGALISLMGLYLACMGPFMFFVTTTGGPASRPATIMVMSSIYLALGLLVLTAAALNITAGIRSLKYRGRTLALVALFCNLVPMFTCYCIPTSLGLMIYGLIVFFHHEVADAFARVADGLPPERVRQGWREEEEEGEEDDWPAPPSESPRRGDNIRRGSEDIYP